MITLPKILFDERRSFSPNLIAMSVPAPTPTSEPKAAQISISGLAIVRPDNASAPTPWPM